MRSHQQIAHIHRNPEPRVPRLVLALLALLAIVLAAVALSSCATPEEVIIAHKEQGEDIKAVVEAYAWQIGRIEAPTPDLQERKERLAEKLATVAERILASHQALANYLDARGPFANAQERDEFLTLVRELRVELDR